MASYDIFSPFDHIQPGPFISRYSDWILFTLLLFLFWGIAGIALRKRFPDSRHLRILTTSISMMMAVGTYYSVYRGWLHLSLAGMGMFGAILLFIVMFFILFGMMRGYGMPLSRALPISYALFYTSLWAISPNILHTIGETIPIVNGILLFLFVVSIFKSVGAFFHHSRQPAQMAKDLRRMDFNSSENMEIDHEINDAKKERKLLKRKTIKQTKYEIRTIEDVEKYLRQMVNVIKENGNNINQHEVDDLVRILRRISQKESILKNSQEVLSRHINAYKRVHRKDISELEKRKHQTKEKKQIQIIDEEIKYQQRMIEVLNFTEKYGRKLNDFNRKFYELLYNALQKLKSRYPNDALSYIQYAYRDLQQMKSIFKKQRDFERYLLKINKKTISYLKKEGHK